MIEQSECINKGLNYFIIDSAQIDNFKKSIVPLLKWYCFQVNLNLSTWSNKQLKVYILSNSTFAYLIS